MRKAKSRTVTELGRLVTRQQLQNAANQIAAHLVTALEKVQAENNVRLTRIEHELGLGAKQGPLPALPPEPERTLALVDADPPELPPWPVSAS